MKISVIGDRDTTTGFRLAGVEDVHTVKTPEEALQKFREVIKSEDAGLVIITERLAEGVREDMERLLEKRSFPLVVEIPDKGGAIERKVDPLNELVRRAVGVEIKIE